MHFVLFRFLYNGTRKWREYYTGPDGNWPGLLDGYDKDVTRAQQFDTYEQADSCRREKQNRHALEIERVN